MKELSLEKGLGGTTGFEPIECPKIIFMPGYFHHCDTNYRDNLEEGIKKLAPKDAVGYMLGDSLKIGDFIKEAREYIPVQFYQALKK